MQFLFRQMDSDFIITPVERRVWRNKKNEEQKNVRVLQMHEHSRKYKNEMLCLPIVSPFRF